MSRSVSPSEPAGDAGPPAQPVLESARTCARDRYLSALLAPADAQGDLVVLAAYLGEVGRVPLLAQDATIGEIRLQWWRDALAAPGPSGHPVADAVRDVRDRRRIDDALLMAPIEGVSRELYEDGVADQRALDLYAEETDGAAIRLALAVLGGGDRDAEADRLAGPGARALTMTRLALALPQHLAHGRLPLPAAFLGAQRDPRGACPAEARAATRVLLARLAGEAEQALAAVRSREGRIDRGLFPAFLPLCLVQPYFKVMMTPKRDVLEDVADLSPLSRVTRLWLAHWRGRI